MEPAEPRVRIRWEPEEVVPGLFRLPLPYSFGSSVNVLLIPGPEGVLMVDAGYPSDDARAIFDSELEQLGLRRGDIRQVLITHADVDHVGLARELQAETGARVLVHARERERGPLWRGSDAWLAANGYPGPPIRHRVEEPALPDRVELVEDGARLCWAGFDFRIIHCPGHTPGLICAHEPARRLLVSTDHVLRAASPIGLFAEPGDPVGDYLQSVGKLRGLAADLVVPGHGRAFSGLDGRLEAIVEEVERELERLSSALTGAPATAWEITERLHAGAEPRRRVMAMFLVLAGLRRLQRTARAVSVEAGGLIRYRAA